MQSCSNCWITGQTLSSENDRNRELFRCCKARPRGVQTTLVFRPLMSVNETKRTAAEVQRQQQLLQQQLLQQPKPDLSCPFVAYWHSLNQLDANRALREAVEADVLVSQNVPWHPFLLPLIDTQIVFDRTPKSAPSSSFSSAAAFLLHVTEFCPGGTLFSTVQDHLRARESSSNQGLHAPRDFVSNFVLSLPSVCRMTFQLLQAVAHLHKHGIAHNAISLHSVLLDADNNVRLGNLSHGSAMALLRSSPKPLSGGAKDTAAPAAARSTSALAARDPNKSKATQSHQQQHQQHDQKPPLSRSISPSPRRPGSDEASRPRNSQLPSSASSSSSSSCCSFCVPPPERQPPQMSAPASAAPEDLRAADVFSCAVVCYELLFGKAPVVSLHAGASSSSCSAATSETSLAMSLMQLTPPATRRKVLQELAGVSASASVSASSSYRGLHLREVAAKNKARNERKEDALNKKKQQQQQSANEALAAKLWLQEAREDLLERLDTRIMNEEVDDINVSTEDDEDDELDAEEQAHLQDQRRELQEAAIPIELLHHAEVLVMFLLMALASEPAKRPTAAQCVAMLCSLDI